MSITLYPAIDLKAGQCVRLLKGDMDAATIYSDNPSEQAGEFARLGAGWIHMVDLDGAFGGSPQNVMAIKSVLKTVDIPVQLGGGIRDLKTMEKWLEAGISRLILGTLALKEPEVVIEACRLFPGKIAVGIDARAGYVAVEGWAETSDISVIDLAKKFEDAGVAALIHTDIDRDGTLTGVNARASSKIANCVNIPIIASGGVAGMDDVHQVMDCGNLEGLIIGKALYDGRINLREATVIASGKDISC